MEEFDKDLTKRVLKFNAHSWHELYYDEILNKPYLIGRKKPKDEPTYMYVMNSKKSFRFNYLRRIVSDTKSSSVLLNIHSPDSTSVYYRLRNGLPDLNKECDEKSSQDSSKSNDEMSSEEEMSDKDFDQEISEEESSEEKFDQDSYEEVIDKTSDNKEAPDSPQTITILD